MNASQISRMIDISCVQAESTLDNIDEAVEVATQYGVFALFSLPAHTPYLIEKAAGTGVIVAGTVGFPHGAASTAGKVFEVREQLAMGCREFDMVNNVAWLKAGKLDLYRQDIEAVKGACNGLPLKVILECHHLESDEIRRACQMCAELGVAFVKTSTGWAETGATIENVALMKQTVGDRCEVKAAGGIRDLDALLDLNNAGATRFGLGVKSARAILEGAIMRYGPS